MQNGAHEITILLIISILLIVMMGGFVLIILFLYRKKQIAYLERISQIQADYEKNIFKIQLEIQEQTFEHISKEIHDNINLSLTLTKLNLNTFDWNDKVKSEQKIENSIDLLSKSILGLGNISKSLNADNIIEHSLVEALRNEIGRIRQAGLFLIEFKIKGTPIFLHSQKELIIFRIIQEAFNNIIKHSSAQNCELNLDYNKSELIGAICDDGIGFVIKDSFTNSEAGLKNMQTRAKILGGTLNVASIPGGGTKILFRIPYEYNGNK